MPFIRVEKGTQGPRTILDPIITMGAYLADGKVHKSRSISFRMTRVLINQLGWTIVQGKIAVAVNEGTGTDKGFLQLVQDDKYGYRGSQGMDKSERQGISINVSASQFKHYVLNECPVPSKDIPHVVDGNTLIIECPDWLRYDPTSVPDEAAPKPEKVVDMHPGRGHRRRRG